MIDFNHTTLPLPPFSWCVSLLFEGGLIILGNALTMAVFWRRRFTLKRTTYLLINLAFADLLVGVSVIATGAIGIFMTTYTQSVLPYLVVNSANIFTTGSSIFSLTIVAVERAHAIVKPLKHRTTKTRYYFNAIRLVWVMATLVCILGMLYTFLYLRTLRFVLIFTSFACLLIICLSYTTIWWFTSKRSRQFLQRHQQNKKLAQTLFIVTFFSLVAWFPGQVLVMSQTTNDLNTGIINAVWSLEFANSLVNPFVYALRMPEFRREVKVLLCKRKGDQREEVIPAGDARSVTLITISCNQPLQFT